MNARRVQAGKTCGYLRSPLKPKRKGRLAPPLFACRLERRPDGASVTAVRSSYVPSFQLAKYSSCSEVSRSILMPSDSSLSLATRLSRSAGTV
jgi:hypothetical protein